MTTAPLRSTTTHAAGGHDLHAGTNPQGVKHGR